MTLVSTWAKFSSNISRWKAAASSAAPIFARRATWTLIPVFWEIGVVGAEIALDRETGRISLDTLVTIGDVGLAIHPAMTEGQDLGAATMGLGAGLFEELIYDGQQLMNGTHARISRAALLRPGSQHSA